MRKSGPRIIFMGTPAFAAFSLKKLHNSDYNIVAVVTGPDKPAGRGQKLSSSEVKKTAIELGIKVLQPEKLKSPDFINQLEALKPDIQVVVAFRMLPEQVWSLPPLGTFNLHASLLPQYRGAAPINWVIMNGEAETGITTFLLDKEIDTGKILFREPVKILQNETAGSLHDRLMQAGAELIMKTIDALASGTANPVNQSELISDPSHLKTAPKLTRDDCHIDWNRSCLEIAAQIRGLNPVPGAFTYLRTVNDTLLIKIFEVQPIITDHEYQPGHFLSEGKTSLMFAAPDGFVKVTSLQLTGKKRMTSSEFLRGFRFSDY
ncbi:MAG TPA: methionyl-tRNA formyltransferase [Bacteroidales bacterium]|nr:methionyl-tRNA formyltransferase [Bacteroidales bacterium]